MLGGRHVQQVAGLLDDDQPVAGPERRGQLVADLGDAVAAEDDRLARREVVERSDRGHGATAYAAHRRAPVGVLDLASMPSSRRPARPTTDAVTDGDEDPTERADDGMAPFIANTGDDDTPDGDADAATG